MASIWHFGASAKLGIKYPRMDDRVPCFFKDAVIKGG